MSAVPTAAPALAPPAGGPQDRAADRHRSLAFAPDRPSGNARFAALLRAYQGSGGTVRGDDLAQSLTEHQQGDDLSLARRVAAGSVFGFRCRQTLWFPMFQFDATDLSVKPKLRGVLSELGGVLDSWQLAVWFAEENTALDGRRPAEAFADDWPAVLHAACARRRSLSCAPTR